MAGFTLHTVLITFVSGFTKDLQSNKTVKYLSPQNIQKNFAIFAKANSLIDPLPKIYLICAVDAFMYSKQLTASLFYLLDFNKSISEF